MKPIDEFMTSIRKRIEVSRQESLDHLERQIQWVLWAVLLVPIGNVISPLCWPHRGRERSEPGAAGSKAEWRVMPSLL